MNSLPSENRTPYSPSLLPIIFNEHNQPLYDFHTLAVPFKALEDVPKVSSSVRQQRGGS
ncbi:hypothetical protein FRB97_003192, partial [Tulasnella sp. 331]